MSQQFFRSFRNVCGSRKFLTAAYSAGLLATFAGLVAMIDQIGTTIALHVDAAAGVSRAVNLRPQLAGTSANASPEAGSGVLATVERWSEVRVDRLDANTRLAHFGTSTKGGGLTTGLTGPAPSPDWTVFSRPSQPAPRISRPAHKPARAKSEPTYRTVCVRLCDGAYFPISFATTPRYFARDSAACASRCGAPARLYTYSAKNGSPQTMHDLDGVPYTKLQTAFKYRTVHSPGCSCKAQPWTEAAEHGQQTASGQSRADTPAAMTHQLFQAVDDARQTDPLRDMIDRAVQAAMAPPIAVEDNLHGRGMLSVLELPTADDRMYAMRFAIPFRAAPVIYDATGSPAAVKIKPQHDRRIAVKILSHVSDDIAAETPAEGARIPEIAAVASPEPVSGEPEQQARTQVARTGKGSLGKLASADRRHSMKRSKGSRQITLAYKTRMQNLAFAWREPDQYDWRKKVFVPY